MAHTIPSNSVRIVEVGPRDGLQNIGTAVATKTKIELIEWLHKAGLRSIELTSVVSPKAVPQLADCRELLGSTSIQQMLRSQDLRLPVLVPNQKGLEIAIDLEVKEIAVFISATEGFSKANINCSVAESLRRARKTVDQAICSGLSVRGYVSCIFSDPFEGPTDPMAVLRGVQELLSMGCYEVSLGDTLGRGTPSQVREVIELLHAHNVPLDRIAGHFHDTYGQAVDNVWEAYQCGIRVFDSSLGGLGGCPFAPGAKGNVATEDLVYMFDQAGIYTGVNISTLLETVHWINSKISRPNNTPVGLTLQVKRPSKDTMTLHGRMQKSNKIHWALLEVATRSEHMQNRQEINIST